MITEQVTEAGWGSLVVIEDHFSFLWSLLVLALISLPLLFGALSALVSFREQTRLLALMRTTIETAGSPLVEDASFVRGTVALLDGDEEDAFPVSMRLAESGLQRRTRSGWSQTWREESRSVSARPFVIVSEAGEHVRVEPPSDVVVHAPLVVVDHSALGQRERRAEVGVGDVVTIRGRARRTAAVLGGAYRESATTWTMGPRNVTGEARMIVSLDPIDARPAAWRTFHAEIAGALLLSFVATQALFYPALYDLWAHARPTLAIVTEVRHDVCEGRVSPRIALRVADDVPVIGGIRFERDVSERDAACLGVGAQVPSLVTPDGHAQLGTDIGLDETAIPFVLAALVITIFALVASRYRRRKIEVWYEQAIVEETSKGRLTI